MSDSTADDAQLRATEAQMRHALGLHGDESPQSPNSESHPQRRRFVRDGEVPVTFVHRDQRRDGERGSHQLDATRQAIRSQASARERAERSLEQAQAAIRELQTKLANERLAKDEAVRRAAVETQTIQQTLQTMMDDLATERAARQQAALERDEAIAGRRKAEERLRDVEAQRAPKASRITPGRKARTAGTIAQPRTAIGAGRDVEGKDGSASPHAVRNPPATILATEAANAAAAMKPTRRRGRPRKVSQEEPDFVEWWVPGWREKL